MSPVSLSQWVIMAELGLKGRLLADRFRVDGKLGAGGMATAWMAFDTRLSRKVVVKVPLSNLLADDRFAQRFQLEISSLTRLAHPHVVGVLDVGTVDDHPYCVLEYMEGGSLSDRLAAGGGKQSLSEVIEWLPKIAEALDHVHEEGMLHRDVKPGNILFDGKGNPALADFGIVKALEGAQAGLTATGQSPGSPGYMAPEILGGEIGPAYDQYSLAAIVYRCVTGSAPKPLQAHIGLVQATGGTLPLPAVSVLQMALSPEPPARFPTCRAFAEAFADGVKDTRTGAVTPPATPGAVASDDEATATFMLSSRHLAVEKRRRSPRVLYAAVGGFLLLAAVVVGGLLVLTRGSSSERESDGGGATAGRIPRIVLDRAALPALLREAQVELRGTVENAGGTRPRLDGRPLALEGDGTFVYRVPLQEGRNRFIITVEGVAGRQAEPVVIEVVRDSVAPQIDLDELPAVTNRPTLEVAGRVRDDHDVEVRLEHRLLASPNDGRFRGEVNLAEGRNVIRIEAVDAAGNRAETESIQVVLDTSPPLVSVDGGPEQFVRSAEFRLEGAVQDAHPDRLIIDDREIRLGEDGSFSVPMTLEGRQDRFGIRSVDRAGNESTLQHVRVTLDSIPPKLEVESPAAGHVAGRSTVEIRIRFEDAHPDSLIVNGVEAEPLRGPIWRAGVRLTEGRNVIEIVGRDRAGNEARARIEVGLDTRPPTLRLESAKPVDGGRIRIRGQIIDDNPSHVVVGAIRREAGKNGAFEVVIALPEGHRGVTVVAHDLAGNRSEAETVTVPSRGPTFQLGPLPEHTKEASVTVTGTIEEDDCQVEINGQAAVVKGRTFSAVVDLDPGKNTIVVVVKGRMRAESRREVAIRRDALPEKPPAEVAALIAKLSDPDAGVRFFAVSKIGRSGYKGAAASLEVVLRDDKDRNVRRAATRALARLNAWRSVPALIDALESTELLVASDANDALKKITGRSFDYFAGMTREQVAAVASRAREWWAAHKDDRPD